MSRDARTGRKVDQWMPIYIGDFVADTTDLNTELIGAYMLLLMALWRKGGELADDDQRLATIARMPAARWRKARAVLSPFFKVEAGIWRHSRITDELEQAAALSQKRSKLGAKGASKRWQADGKSHSKSHGNSHGNSDGPAIDLPMANDTSGQWQNDGPSPSPIPRATATEARPTPYASERTPGGGDEREQVGQFEGQGEPPPQPRQLTPYVLAAMVLQRHGYRDAHAHHPDLVALVDEGVRVEHLEACAARFAGQGKPAAYAVNTARREHAQGASAITGGPHAASVNGRESVCDRVARKCRELDARDPDLDGSGIDVSGLH